MIQINVDKCNFYEIRDFTYSSNLCMRFILYVMHFLIAQGNIDKTNISSNNQTIPCDSQPITYILRYMLIYTCIVKLFL